MITLNHQCGSELQCLAIDNSLANERALVLADEPKAELDIERGGNAVGTLRKIADQRRSAVIAQETQSST